MIYKKLKFDTKQDAIVNSTFRFLGQYSPDKQYIRGDVVSFNKKYYVYINDTPSINNNPLNTTYWEEYDINIDKDIYSKTEVDNNFVSKSDSNVVMKNLSNTFTKTQTFQSGLGSGALSHFYGGLYTYVDPYQGDVSPFRVISRGYLENNYYSKQDIDNQKLSIQLRQSKKIFTFNINKMKEILQLSFETIENINNIVSISLIEMYPSDANGVRNSIVDTTSYYISMNFCNLKVFSNINGKLYSIDNTNNIQSLYDTFSTLGVNYFSVEVCVIYD